MNINQAFPSKFISEPDLFGQSLTLTMMRTAMEDIGRSEIKPVLYFQNHEKGLILNVTNANNIASIYGPETDNWMGQAIELYPATTDFAGKTVPCVRVRRPVVAVAGAHQVPQQTVPQTLQQRGNASQTPAGPAPGQIPGDPLNYEA